MTLNRANRYVFMLRDEDGVERIAYRFWAGRRWHTAVVHRSTFGGYSDWRVRISATPLWRGGPSMVLEVPGLGG